MLHTKEFEDAMKAFEKIAKKFTRVGSMGFTKEPEGSWIRQSYYCDGNLNEAFIMFLNGVSFAKCYYS